MKPNKSGPDWPVLSHYAGIFAEVRGTLKNQTGSTLSHLRHSTKWVPKVSATESALKSAVDKIACKTGYGLPMTQSTLVLLKPDAVARNLTGEVIARIERKGYKIAALQLRTASAEVLHQHYEEHAGRSFFEPLVGFMSSGPLVALVVTGDRVIEGIRSLCGTTDPTTAAPGTIRGDYGRDWGTDVQQNLIHASDSPESAQREISLWFSSL